MRTIERCGLDANRPCDDMGYNEPEYTCETCRFLERIDIGDQIPVKISDLEIGATFALRKNSPQDYKVVEINKNDGHNKTIGVVRKRNYLCWNTDITYFEPISVVYIDKYE